MGHEKYKAVIIVMLLPFMVSIYNTPPVSLTTARLDDRVRGHWYTHPP